MKHIFTLENISAYTISRELTNNIYILVNSWKWLDKQTLGLQMIRSVDSIAANIAEGFGRYHKADKIKFYYNARGSTLESLHWLAVAKDRKLLTTQLFVQLNQRFQMLPKEINTLIRLQQII